jgi:hypothetical protein
MYRPVFIVSVCAAGAVAAVKPNTGLGFVGGQTLPLRNAAHAATTSSRPVLRNAATQLRAADEQPGWMANAKKSLATGFMTASIAFSGFMGAVPAAPVHAELAPDAKLILAEDLGSNAMIQLAKTYDFSNIKSCPTLPQQFHFLTAP